MPTVGGALKKRKSKSGGLKRKTGGVHKRKTVTHKRAHTKKSSKYSLLSSDKLRKLISRYNKGKSKEKRLRTTVKVRKGAKVVVRPKKKSALVTLCKKHKL